MTKYQVTLYDKENRNRPVSCIITSEVDVVTTREQKKELIRQGTQKICNQRYWTKLHILKYNYLVAKIRKVEE